MDKNVFKPLLIASFCVTTVCLIIIVRLAYGVSGFELFAAAAATVFLVDAISTAACLLGKMKDRSIIYSVCRLFIIVFAYNFIKEHPLFFIIIVTGILMYVCSLLKSFRSYASRNSNKEQ